VALGGDESVSKRRGINLGFAGEQAHDEGLSRHLQGEHGDLLPELDRRVARHVEGEGRLSHRGPRRDDEEIALLEPARHLVERAVTRGQAGEVAATIHQYLDVIDGAVDLDVEGAQGTPGLLLAESEDLRLRRVEQLSGFLGLVVAEADDLGGDTDQAALHGLVAHDARVMYHVGGGRFIIGDVRQRHRPADALEQII